MYISMKRWPREDQNLQGENIQVIGKTIGGDGFR